MKIKQLFKTKYHSIKYRKPIILVIIGFCVIATFFLTKDSLSYLGYIGSNEVSVNKGLVAHYTMDEDDYNTSTGILNDKTPNQNHGTNSGATFTEDRFGKQGGAVSFDGLSIHQKVNHSEEFEVQDSYTVSAWFKPITFQDVDIRISSRGYNDSLADRYVYVNGNYIGSAPRSYQIVRLDENWNFIERTIYDTYSGSRYYEDDILAMEQYLADLPIGSNIIINTNDEPKNNVYNNDSLINEMENFGATRTIIENMDTRSSYILIGQKGIGPGNAIVEKYGPRYGTGLYYDSGDIIRKGTIFGLRTNDNNLELMTNLNYHTISDIEKKWNHVVLYYNGTTKKVYYNGELVNSFSASIPNSDERDLWIGGALGFNGLMDDVRIYNRALSQEEIQSLYDSYEPKTTTGSLQKGLILDMPLKLKYTKDETNGSEIMTDRTPYSNDGQNHGATITSEGASFDSLSHKRITGEIEEYDDGLTLSAWIKPESYPSERFTIIQGTNPASYYLSLYSNGSINTYWYLTDPQGYHSGNAGSVDLNKWSHVVGSWDGLEAKIYVNGIKENTISVSGLGRIPTEYNIGAESISRQFIGDISNTKIYNRALSDTEVKMLYDRGRSDAGIIFQDN